MSSKYYGEMVAYITGGTSGIGLDLAKNYLKKGCKKMCLVSRSAVDNNFISDLKKLSQGDDAIIVHHRADVSNQQSLEDSFKRAETEIGTPNLIINSAGIAFSYGFKDISQELFQKVININLIGSANIARVGIPYLKKTKGHLVFVASMAGIIPSPGYSAYGASKFGVMGLGNILKLEMATHGVGVSLVCPPEVITPMIEEERKHISKTALELKKTAGSLPLEKIIPTVDKGIRNRKFLVIPGTKAKLLNFSSTRLPNITRTITTFLYKTYLKKFNEQPL